MKVIGYLLVGLAVMVVMYMVYRRTFLVKPKSKPTQKPHFTLKIEPEI